MLNSIEKSGLEVQLTSLTEVLVIILFALLLFNYSSLDKVEIKIREVQELNRQIAGQEKKLNDKSQEIRILKETLKTANEKLDVVMRFIAPKMTPRQISNQQLQSLLEQILSQKNASVIKQVGVNLAKDVEIEALQQQIEELKKELAKVRGTGTDKPKCIIPGLNSQYDQIARVEIFPDTYKVFGNWNHATEEMYVASVPGLRALQNATLGRAEFTNAARKIFSWSKQQPEECRFRVDLKLSDSTKELITSEGIKRISLVTRYFYERRIR